MKNTRTMLKIMILFFSFFFFFTCQSLFAQTTDSSLDASADGAMDSPVNPSIDIKEDLPLFDQQDLSEEVTLDPNKEVVEMSQTELDKLQEEIAKIEDPALKSEMLGVVAQEMQIVVVDPNTTAESTEPPVDIATPEGQTQALQQLEGSTATLIQNGISQQTLSNLKEAIAGGDKVKVETLMSEMAQNMSPNLNNPMGAPMGDFDKGMMPMPVFEMMKDFGVQPPPGMEMGAMKDMSMGAPPMEIVDFKDFYTGVRVEEMGVAMMEKGGFSAEQIDQFTEKAKMEIFNHPQGEGAFDPKMVFEGVFKEVFGSMMEGQNPMMGQHQGPEVFGPNSSMPMEAMMLAQGGPNAPMPMGGAPGEFAFNGPQGNFNFNEFMTQNQNIMGEIAYMANPENSNHPGGFNGPQGFEGPGQFNGPGPFAGGPQGQGGFEVFQQGPGGPFSGGPFEGPIPGFDPNGGFQGPGNFEGFQGAEFQAPEFQPPPELPPPPPGEGTPPPPPPEKHHHDLGEALHVDGDAHPCATPQCS